TWRRPHGSRSARGGGDPVAEPAGARDAILGRVRAALADHPRPPAVTRDYIREPESDLDVVELFAERAGDYQATVEILAQPEVAAAIGRSPPPRGGGRGGVPPGVSARRRAGAGAGAAPARRRVGEGPPP